MWCIGCLCVYVYLINILLYKLQTVNVAVAHEQHNAI